MRPDDVPTRRERRKLRRACKKLRLDTKLVDALNAKAQLQAQRKGAPGTKGGSDAT